MSSAIARQSGTAPASSRSSKLHIDDGCMGGGTSVTHDDELTIEEWYGWEDANNDNIDDDGDSMSLNGNHLYGNHFTDNRLGIFHYLVMCHLEINDPWDRDILGRGFCPGALFVLYDQNLGGTWPWTDRTTMQAHVFMHEMGHNLLGFADHLDGTGHCSHTCAMQTNLNPWDTHAIDYCSECWLDINLARSLG